MFIPGISYPTGKDAIQQWIWANVNKNSTILDIGAGNGTYADLVGSNHYQIDAVEVFAPTLPFIINKYRTIYCIDILKFEYPYNYDLIIFGDILEHLEVKEAQKVLTNALQHCKMVLVAVPFKFPQEIYDDNPYELHKQTDLDLDIMTQRYPQLHLLLYIDCDTFFYAYYIGKGALYE